MIVLDSLIVLFLLYFAWWIPTLPFIQLNGFTSVPNFRMIHVAVTYMCTITPCTLHNYNIESHVELRTSKIAQSIVAIH